LAAEWDDAPGGKARQGSGFPVPSAALNDGTLTLDAAVRLDVRRAAWLPRSRCLVVADLHLGRAWVQRARGQMVPVAAADDTLPRLSALVHDYRPERMVVVGDVVHAALTVAGIESAVRELVAIASDGLRLELCLGNHDRRLRERLVGWKLPVAVSDQIVLDEAILFHGDVPPAVPDSSRRWRIQGHEHPAVVLGDGVATSAKVPCFLVGTLHLVLPAFSATASGCVVGRDPFLSEPARGARLDTVVACLGRRLLRIPLDAVCRPPHSPTGSPGPGLFPDRRIRP
jgi:uncharacterized protein